MRTLDANELTAIGGRLWEKNGERRVYFNRDEMAELIGLEISFYNTGNVSRAVWNGEKISNSYGKDILYRLASMKLWFDLNDQKFRWRADEQAQSYAHRVVRAIREKLGVVQTQETC